MAEPTPIHNIDWRAAIEHPDLSKLERIPPDPIDEKPRLEIAHVPDIPPRFEAATFDSYIPATELQRKALRTMRAFVKKVTSGTPLMLALIGPTGCGKSHLAYAAVRALYDAGHTVYCRPWYVLGDELRWGGESPFAQQQGAKLDAPAVRRLLWSQRVVFIDEVLATASTAMDENELSKFAHHAYDRNLTVLITTRVHPLRKIMGDAAERRFAHLRIDKPVTK